MTFVLWLALGIEAFFAVLSIAAYALRLHVIGLIEAGGPLTPQTVDTSNHFVHVVAELSTPMLLIVFVILLVWVHQVRKNLEAFRAGPFRFSPAFAVWSFIIPVASLWLPYGVMQEIWKGSDPGVAPFSPEPFWARRGSPLVVAWWAVFLVNDLFSLAVVELLLHTGGDHSLAHFRLAAQLYIASRALRIASVVLTGTLAHRIVRRQETLALQVGPRSGAASVWPTAVPGAIPGAVPAAVPTAAPGAVPAVPMAVPAVPMAAPAVPTTEASLPPDAL